MKPRLLRLFLVACFTACLSAADTPPVYLELTNASFEAFDAEAGMPVGWHNNSQTVVVSDDVVASDGERSMQVIFFGAMQDLYCSRSIKIDDPNATYRATIDVRKQDCDSKLELRAYRYPAPIKQKLEAPHRGDETTDGWQQLTLDIPPKEGMTSITLFLFARGTWGRLWIDNLRIEKLEAN